MHPEQLKHLLRMDKPSHHLTWMAQGGKLGPELDILMRIPQDTEHHPEGDAFTHTMMVVDEAVLISRREKLDPFDHAVLFLAALTHDMGKATNTQITNGKITAYGHPEAGIKPATEFMQRNKVSEFVMQQVIPLVNLHMAWVGFYTPDITSKSVRKLVRKVHPSNLNMLALVVEADMSGRGGKWYKQGLPQRMKDILTVAETLNNPVDQYPEPLISGDDIMEVMGIEPSPLLGKIKAALYRAQLEGRFHTKADGIFFLLHHVVIAENS